MLQTKDNQPKLRAYIVAQQQADPTPALDTICVAKRRIGALCTWWISVYFCTDPDLQAAWTGLTRVVVVKTVQWDQQMSRQTRYYLTSLRATPVAELAAGIRGYGGIENKLHRPRDVHFQQDTNGIRHPVGTANTALLNTLALNYLLLHVHQAVTYAQRYFAQNFKQFLPPNPRS